uniref:SWIM-type domain-containing protein n=1 Tax=Globisporangium ultimum (strain ATCC 200006 / CBS 805.95 / DAOM BR144) TaxID=431595 RepID=K3WC20_GLOUD
MSSVVVFMGTLTSQTRKEAVAEAERRGYKVGSNMTKTTTFLVCGDNVGAKKKQETEKWNVQVLTEAEWTQKLSEGASAAVAAPTEEPKPATRKRKVQAAEAADGDDAPKSDEQEVVVFTGTLVKQSRKEATREAEAKGFRVLPKTTKATTYLVYGDRAGQKLKEAKKLNVTVLTEDEWEQKLSDMASSGTSSSSSRFVKKQATGDIAASAGSAEETSSDEVEYDDETGAINGIKPKVLIPDGTFHEAQSASSSATYLVKRLGSTYTCNCPAWRNQRHAPTSRTCKHLKQLLGEEFEAVRAKDSSTAPRASTLSAKGKSGSGSPKKTASAKLSAPKVLLANKWERKKHNPANWWISEKLDGVRAYWDAKQRVFLSRLGNVYPAPEWFTNGFPDDMDLDGELFGGRGKFQFTVGIAKTDSSKHWDQLVYKVFDTPSLAKKKFEERMKHAQELVSKSASKYIEWVEHTQCKSLEHLDEVFDAIEKLGGEGLMIRQPGSAYAEGRSPSLLKIKSFHDGEAVVIAHEDGKGKYVGMTGALRCKMASGKMFKCASGLSDEQRANPPKVGSIIVYKCQELTNDGIPRFPVFLGVAADKTCAKDPIIANAVGRE